MSSFVRKTRLLNFAYEDKGSTYIQPRSNSKKIERTFLINSYQRHASFCLGDWPKMFIHLSFEIIRIYHVNLLVWVPTVGRNIV